MRSSISYNKSASARRGLVIAGLAATVLLGACGGSTKSATTPTTAKGSTSSTTATASTSASTAAPTTVPRTTVAPAATDKWGKKSQGATSTTAPQVVVTGGLPPFKHASPLDDLIATALVDLDGYWAEVMPQLYNIPWKPISGGYFPYTSASNLPPCPGVKQYADVAQNAFYCPAADLVAWDDEGLIPDLDAKYGDFTLGIVMAHEIAHAVQTRINLPATLTVTKEEQADCFAGAWVASVANGNSKNFQVKLNDLDGAVAGFLELRDEPGSSGVSKGAHGSAFDRIGSFQEGFEDGAKACATYTDENIATRLVQIPFTNADDQSSGGNLPFDQVLPAVDADLNSFWSTVFLQAGMTWEPIDPTERADRELAVKLYDNIGDFAAATLLGRAYASFVQERLGEGGTPLQQSLQADCLTGSWAASMFLKDRPDAALSMSPGDLDKAVMALLVMGDSADDVQNGSATTGSPFQRVSALRTGFMTGIAACARITQS